jgi:hypothetical protein
MVVNRRKHTTARQNTFGKTLRSSETYGPWFANGLSKFDSSWAVLPPRCCRSVLKLTQCLSSIRELRGQGRVIFRPSSCTAESLESSREEIQRCYGSGSICAKKKAARTNSAGAGNSSFVGPVVLRVQPTSPREKQEAQAIGEQEKGAWFRSSRGGITRGTSPSVLVTKIL